MFTRALAYRSGSSLEVGLQDSARDGESPTGMGSLAMANSHVGISRALLLYNRPLIKHVMKSIETKKEENGQVGPG